MQLQEALGLEAEAKGFNHSLVKGEGLAENRFLLYYIINL